MAQSEKFEQEDLPRILVALHQARESKARATVRVEFDVSGGVIAIELETKKKIK